MKGLRPQQAAAYAKVSRSCLADWVRTGKLRAVQVDGKVAYRLADLDRLIISRPRRGRKPS